MFDSIITRFERIAVRYRDKLAIDSETERLTYGDLNRSANRIADIILSREGADNKPVVHFYGQGYQQVVACLGVLKARKIHCPINTFFEGVSWGHRGFIEPVTIRAFMESVAPCMVLTDDEHWSMAKEFAGARLVVNTERIRQASVENPGIKIAPEDKSAILHSSGTTGEPKAILRDHAFESYNQLQINHSPALPGDKCTGFRTQSPGAFHDFLFAFLNGSTLCLYDLRKPGLSEWIVEKAITVFRAVGTVYRMLEPGRFYHFIRQINIGGEMITTADAIFFEENFTRAHFIDRYASSELGEITHNGKALGDRIIEIDRAGQIVIESDQMAIGYWDNPELTQQKFFPLENGRRRYMTGDKGYLENGLLVLQGRLRRRERRRA